MPSAAVAPWKRMLQRLASELDHREERLQDCIFREGMVLALSEVAKSLKYWTGLCKVGELEMSLGTQTP